MNNIPYTKRFCDQSKGVHKKKKLQKKLTNIFFLDTQKIFLNIKTKGFVIGKIGSTCKKLKKNPKDFLQYGSALKEDKDFLQNGSALKVE